MTAEGGPGGARRPAWVIITGALVLLLAAAGAVWGAVVISRPRGPRVTAPSARSLHGKEVWILTAAALGDVVDHPQARSRLASGVIFEALPKDKKPTSGLDIVPTQIFTSERALARSLNDGRLRPGVRAVLYDAEHWQFTPMAEQLDVAGAIRRAAEVAHQHGLLFIAAPALNVVRATSSGGRAWQEFLARNIAGAAAADADVVDIQAQALIRNTSEYASFLSRAAAQARAANPHVIVLAGLSTNPPGAPISASLVVDAMRASRGIVNGWWLNIPRPGPHCPRCSPTRPDFAINALANGAASLAPAHGN